MVYLRAPCSGPVFSKRHVQCYADDKCVIQRLRGFIVFILISFQSIFILSLFHMTEAGPRRSNMLVVALRVVALLRGISDHHVRWRTSARGVGGWYLSPPAERGSSASPASLQTRPASPSPCPPWATAPCRSCCSWWWRSRRWGPFSTNRYSTDLQMENSLQSTFSVSIGIKFFCFQLNTESKNITFYRTEEIVLDFLQCISKTYTEFLKLNIY